MSLFTKTFELCLPETLVLNGSLIMCTSAVMNKNLVYFVFIIFNFVSEFYFMTKTFVSIALNFNSISVRIQDACLLLYL